MFSYILSLAVPSPSSCAAAVVALAQQEAESHGCRDPTRLGRERGWCGNVGNVAAHESGSPHGLGS